MQRVSNFWAMLLIIAKYAARSPWEDTMGLIGMGVQPLREVSEYLGLSPRYVMEILPPHGQPQEKIRLLRALADEMEALMPAIEARSGSVPWAALPHARRFLDLVEAVTRGEEDNGSSGQSHRRRTSP